MLNTILIDAGPIIALFDKDDKYHKKANIFLDFELYILYLVGHIPSHLIRNFFYNLAFMFVEVEDKSFADNTKGKKFSFHSGIKFSKCNAEYVSRFFENKGWFISKKGTYEDCIASFERDYNAIATYLNLQVQAIDGKAMEPLMVKTVYDAIINIKSTANRVDSMKATRTDYKSLLNQISALEVKLLGNK